MSSSKRPNAASSSSNRRDAAHPLLPPTPQPVLSLSSGAIAKPPKTYTTQAKSLKAIARQQRTPIDEVLTPANTKLAYGDYKLELAFVLINQYLNLEMGGTSSTKLAKASAHARGEIVAKYSTDIGKKLKEEFEKHCKRANELAAAVAVATTAIGINTDPNISQAFQQLTFQQLILDLCLSYTKKPTDDGGDANLIITDNARYTYTMLSAAIKSASDLKAILPAVLANTGDMTIPGNGQAAMAASAFTFYTSIAATGFLPVLAPVTLPLAGASVLAGVGAGVAESCAASKAISGANQAHRVQIAEKNEAKNKAISQQCFPTLYNELIKDLNEGLNASTSHSNANDNLLTLLNNLKFLQEKLIPELTTALIPELI